MESHRALCILLHDSKIISIEEIAQVMGKEPESVVYEKLIASTTQSGSGDVA